jgi:hypothetical protein
MRKRGARCGVHDLSSESGADDGGSEVGAQRRTETVRGVRVTRHAIPFPIQTCTQELMLILLPQLFSLPPLNNSTAEQALLTKIYDENARHFPQCSCCADDRPRRTTRFVDLLAAGG